MDKNRSGMRKMLGYGDGDIVLFIASSHGDNSLLESIGHELISEALTLPSKYKFIFCSKNIFSLQKSKRYVLI